MLVMTNFSRLLSDTLDLRENVVRDKAKTFQVKHSLFSSVFSSWVIAFSSWVIFPTPY